MGGYWVEYAHGYFEDLYNGEGETSSSVFFPSTLENHFPKRIRLQLDSWIIVCPSLRLTCHPFPDQGDTRITITLK